MPPVESTAREIVAKSVEAGLNVIPLVGGPLAVAFAYAVGHSFNKRMSLWLEEVAQTVSDLVEEVDGLSLDALVDDDRFVDAVATATRAAERTHQRAKIEALRNAVLSSTLPGAPDTDTQMIFFRLIDDFTVAHLQILTLLNDPVRWCERRHIPVRRDGLSGSRRQLVEEALPEFAGRREFCDAVVRDLTAAGLLSIGGLDGMMTSSGVYVPATTSFGQEFIAFIADPRRAGQRENNEVFHR